MNNKWLLPLAACTLALLVSPLWAAEAEKPVEREYVTAPAAPHSQTWEQADAKSAGCLSCHAGTDEKTMHASRAVVLGCTDCHGGNADVWKPDGIEGVPLIEAHHGDGHDDRVFGLFTERRGLPTNRVR